MIKAINLNIQVNPLKISKYINFNPPGDIQVDRSKSKNNIKLVGGITTPLKNMSSSVGMVIPNIWKTKNVPNHQPDKVTISISLSKNEHMENPAFIDYVPGKSWSSHIL